MDQEQIRALAAKLYALSEANRNLVAGMFEDLASVLRTHHALQGALSATEELYIFNELQDLFKILEEAQK